MKIFFILFFTLTISINPVFAIQEIIAPSWDEICPQEFLNAEYIETKQEKPSLMRKMLYIPCFCPVIGVSYIVYNSINNQKKKEKIIYNQKVDYWKKRELNFNNSVQNCKALSNEQQPECFMKIREFEITRDAKNMELKLLNEQNRQLRNINNTIYYK